MSAVAAVGAVVGRINSLGLTGKIYNAMVATKTDAAFAEMFVVDSTINAWIVTRESSVGEDIGAQLVKRTNEVVIYGYRAYQIDGAQEPLFQADVDAICAAFDPLGGENGRTFSGQFDWSGPMRVLGPKIADWRGVKVHFCRMSYPITDLPTNQ